MRRLEAIAAAIIIVGFLLPWIQFGGLISLRGYEIPARAGQLMRIIHGFERAAELPSGEWFRLLFLIPVSALVTIGIHFSGRSTDAVALFSGILVVGAAIVFAALSESDALDYAGPGVWVTVAGGAVLLLCGVESALGGPLSKRAVGGVHRAQAHGHDDGEPEAEAPPRPD